MPSLSNTYTYDNPSNFTVGSDAEVAANATLTEIGLQTGELYSGRFQDDEDLDRGASTTCTLVGSAAHVEISGVGYIDLRGGNNSTNLTIPSTNVNNSDVGALRFRFTPDYTGSPAKDVLFYNESQAVGLNQGAINFRHKTTGQIALFFADSGALVVLTADIGAWSPTSGQEYEMELNWDVSGAPRDIRFFIDGTQLGSTQTGASGRGAPTIGYVVIGQNQATSTSCDGLFRDMVRFDSVQHIANYTAPIAATIYSTDAQSVEPNASVLADSITSIVENVSAPANTKVNYVIKEDSSYKYWNGSAWATSDQSESQSNTFADFNTNIAALDISAGVSAKPILLLISDDGVTNLTASSLTINYDFFQTQVSVTTCIVYGYVLDGTNPVSGARVSFRLDTMFASDANIQEIDEAIATSSSGFFDIALPVTSTTNNEVKVTFEFMNSNGRLSKKEFNISVPNTTTCAIDDIIV